MLEIIEVERGHTPAQRDEGLYLATTYGTVLWPEPDGTTQYKARGVTLWLMDGASTLAVYKEEAVSAEAREIREREGAAISAWAPALRSLLSLRELLDDREMVANQTRLLETHPDADFMPPTGEGDTLTIRRYATADDYGPDHRDDTMRQWAAVGRSVLRHLDRTIRDRRRRALAVAPEVETQPADVFRGWAIPAPLGLPSTPLGPEVARHLLAAWATVDQQRDPLIRWAVTNAGLEKAAAHAASGVARTTIDRIL